MNFMLARPQTDARGLSSAFWVESSDSAGAMGNMVKVSAVTLA
jgi:hypothetical protein